MECVFPPGEAFKHYDLKWRDHRLLQWRPVTDDALARELMRISAALFEGLGGSGYARCDIRVASNGLPYMLDINPNCSVFYPPDEPGGADAVLLSVPDGHEDFVDTILADGLARRRASRRRYVVEFSGDRRASGCTPPRRSRQENGSAVARSKRTRWLLAVTQLRIGRRGSGDGSSSTAIP